MVKNVKDLPSSTTILTNGLDDVFDASKKIFMKHIQAMPDIIFMTFDFWTDAVKRCSFITFTCHWSDNFQLKNACLKTESFPERHTAVNIKTKFEELLIEFDIKSTHIICVTDGGPNIVKACQLLGLTRNGCILHKIHNLITTDFTKYEGAAPYFLMMKKIKRILFALIYRYEELRASHEKLKSQAVASFFEALTQQGKNTCFGFYRFR